MKKLTILWILLGISCYLQAQIISVKDKETGDFLELVTVASKSPRVSAITNIKGQVDISAFKGADAIAFRAIGYKTQVFNYELIKDTSIVELVPAVISLDELVISATRWNQVTTDIPSKAIAISPKSMALLNPQTAADMLAVSGKVFIQKSQQGGGSPMIRGFATNRLLYSIDGVRMNTAIFRSGNIQNVISLDPFSLEHAEVLFGPGTVIYGSDAIGGVMSFQTLTPYFSLTDKPLVSGKALTRYSSANNEKTAHFDINLGWKKWAIITSISSNDYDDLKMGSYGPEEYLRPFSVKRIDSTDAIVTNDDPRIQRPTGYSQINMMQKIRFKPNDFWDLQYGFHYSETSDYSRYDRHIRYKNGLPRYGEWSYGPQKWMMNNLIVNYSKSNVIYDEITLRLAYQIFEESRISRDINDPAREIRKEHVDAYSASIDFTKTISIKDHLFYGFEAVRNDVLSEGINEDIETGIMENGPSRYPQSMWSSYAFYFSNKYRPVSNISILTGLRYSRFRLDAEFDTIFYPFPFTEAKINDGSLTGSLGIVFHPTDQLVVSSNLSTAFRSPNVDDVGKVFDSEPGSVTVPNPDLDAEYAYNVDISIAKTFGDVFKVDFTGYYTLLQNALVRRDYTLNGLDSILYDGEMSKVQAIQNAAVANVYGLQAGIYVKLTNGFGISSDFNYQKGEEELDDGTVSPSRHAAPWFGITRLTYTANKLNLKLYVVYSGEKKFEDLPEDEKGKDYIYAIDENGNPYSPAWYSLNFKAMYQLTEELTVSGGVENITDRRYRPYSSGIVAPGRNLVLSLKANF